MLERVTDFGKIGSPKGLPTGSGVTSPEPIPEAKTNKSAADGFSVSETGTPNRPVKRRPSWLRRTVIFTATTAALMAGAHYGSGVGIDSLPVGSLEPNMQTVELVEGQLISAQRKIEAGPEQLQALLRGVGTVRLQVTHRDGATLVGDPGAGLSLADNTTANLSLSRRGLGISSSPGLNAEIPYFLDVQVNNLRYNFATASFQADAEGLGFDSWYTDRIERLANRLIKPRLPEAMQLPGYNPAQDPELLHNIALLAGRFGPPAADEAVVALAPPVDVVPPPVVAESDPATEPADIGVSDVGLSLSTTLGEEISFDLQDRHVVVPAGAVVWAELATEGAVDDLRLDAFRLNFRPSIDLGQMQLDGVTLRANGQITARYDLEVENTVTGLKALVVVLAAAADPRVALANPSVSQTRLEGVRQRIQNKIDGDMEPQLESFIRELDTEIPELNLTRIFGFAPDTDFYANK